MPNSPFLDDLPETLAYLKQPAKDIAAQDQDLLGSGEADLTAFETALRGEMAGLSPAEADIRCSQHLRLLDDWLGCHQSQDDPYILALHFLSGAFAAAHEIVEPCDDDEAERLAPTFLPRLAKINLPKRFKISQRGQDVVASDGAVEFLIREIDKKSCHALMLDFASPSRKTTTSDGVTIHPQSTIALSFATGTKNVIERNSEKSPKEVTYLLQFHEWFAMVRLTLPVTEFDESQLEPVLDSIAFD